MSFQYSSTPCCYCARGPPCRRTCECRTDRYPTRVKCSRSSSQQHTSSSAPTPMVTLLLLNSYYNNNLKVKIGGGGCTMDLVASWFSTTISSKMVHLKLVLRLVISNSSSKSYTTISSKMAHHKLLLRLVNCDSSSKSSWLISLVASLLTSSSSSRECLHDSELASSQK